MCGYMIWRLCLAHSNLNDLQNDRREDALAALGPHPRFVAKVGRLHPRPSRFRV